MTKGKKGKKREGKEKKKRRKREGKEKDLNPLIIIVRGDIHLVFASGRHGPYR